MAIAKIDGIEVPKVYEQNISREYAYERARTAGFKLRQDSFSGGNVDKKTWELDTRDITKEKAYQLIDYLQGINWGSVDFEIDEEEGIIEAYVEITGEPRTEFSKAGEWINNGRQLTLQIVER